jgi:hypothetical protein
MGEAAPVALLGQHLHQQIEGMDRGQQRQQMESPQLCGTEVWSASRAEWTRQQRVDEIVGNKRRQFAQQCGSARARE